VNEKLARFESIKRFKLLGADFSVDGGELTPTMKLRRKEIAKKYEKEIEALFAEAPPAASSSAA
jgi:long-chain acyl-CoA synthetase